MLYTEIDKLLTNKGNEQTRSEFGLKGGLRWLDLPFQETFITVQLLIEYIRGMNDKLNIPQCIKNYGADSYPTETGFVPEEVFLERLPEIAKNAIADACTGSNPRQPSQEEMEKLLKCCYYDTEVDL